MESAGFSKSNPFYIVPQGRITSITNAKESERLALLKEVAGTRVYEQRRAESLKIMMDTDLKREKINELLEYIESRLDELEQEKEELSEFQSLDKERRCIEYAIYSNEQDHASLSLEQLDEKRMDELESFKVGMREFTNQESELFELQKEIQECQSRLEILASERGELIPDREEYVKSKAQVENALKDLKENQSSHSKTRKTLENQMKELEKSISLKESELASLIPNYESLCTRELQIKSDLSMATIERDALISKQGRFAQFKTQKERDAWLQLQLENSKESLNSLSLESEKLQSELNESQNGVTTLEKDIQRMNADYSENKKEIQQLSVQLENTKMHRNALDEKRKEMWRQDAKGSSILDNMKQELSKYERILAGCMDKNTCQGLENVKNIVKRHQIQGVYGPLIDLFKVQDVYAAAVEVVAGNSLFHVVVDTDETASRILDILIKEKGGRVTFMPLNRLHPHEMAFPESEEVIPMIQKLQYEPVLHSAFLQVKFYQIICNLMY